MPEKTRWITCLLVLGFAIAVGGTQVNQALAGEKKKDDGKKELKSDDKKKAEKGKLAAFEKKVEKGSESKDEEKEKEEDHADSCTCSSCDSESNPIAVFFGEMIWAGTQTLLVGSPAELEQPRAFREPFARYPYRSSTDGLFAKQGGKPLALELSSNYFYHNESLMGWEIRGKFSPLSFLTLEGKYSRLTERGLPGSSNLEFVNLFLNFNRVRTNRVVLYWGAGLRVMRGERTYPGFAFDVGAEVYPFRPVSLSASYVGSWLNGVYVPEFTGTVNVHIGRTAIFAGYQSWSAGGERIDGLVTGVKVFF
jgi:hypothetical protein